MTKNSMCKKCKFYDSSTNSCWSNASILYPMTGIKCKYFEKGRDTSKEKEIIILE